MRKICFVAIPLLLAATVIFTTFAPVPAQSSVIDFEDPPLGRLDRQVINPYVDAPSKVTFSALDARSGVVGVVKNSATSACVEPVDSNQKLGTAPVDSDSIGLSGFAIRADFPAELAPPVRVGVTFQTGEKVPIRIRLFDANGGEVGTTSDFASPGNGTCNLPGDPRARKTIFATSSKSVAYAVMDLEDSTGGRVFVLDDFQYSFNERPNEIGDIAYILSKDTASAAAFEVLLNSEGYDVDLIQLGSVLSTDFTPYQMILIADDTGSLSNWGDDPGQVKQIIAGERPIIGLGEGGYAFFGQVDLQIGHGNGWHRSEKAVVGKPALVYYQTPYDLTSELADALDLYTDEVGEVGIHLPEPIADVIPLGREPENKTHYPLIAQKVLASRVRGKICHQLWGFDGNPRQMTKAGQQLFANAVNFGLSSCPDERPVDPTPTQAPPPTPTRTPRPTWTPLPTNTPTPGPTATPFPLVQAIPYRPINEFLAPPTIIQPDLSIHGIELTQGVQCFDTSNGLSGCGDNALPLVAKKNSTARIYLKYGGVFTSLSNVPVRLFIRANGVDYTANVSGKAVKTLDQSTNDSADVYFNVNFNSDIAVDFYAIIDPDGIISETNESNNRFPASGFITRTFRKGITLDIVGQRLDYHPSGYTGTRRAGGWAVNGGAADYLEQLLPIRTNGIDYSVKSGYLDWTKSLGSGDNQHDLIKSLNSRWIMENAFSWLFGTGAFTGAEHVYGWAPNSGYSGGHADMPVYPHAGGLGVVGIGTDRPGTSTDNPGGGALIFAHELIHDYDVKHTNTGGDDCGSNDSSSTYPYNTSSIQEFGFNPITGKIYDPADTHDVMSYCPAGGSKQGWISPFTWNYMFNRLDAAAVNAAEQRAAPKVMRTTVMTRSVVVNVTVYNPDAPEYNPEVPGLLGDLHLIDGGIQYDPPTGEYEIQLRNGDEVVASQSFAASFKSEYDGHVGHNHGVVASDEDEPPFPATPTLKSDVSFIMPWPENVDNVALVFNDDVIDMRNVSSSAPIVNITSPNEAVEWPADSRQELTWEATDPDSGSGALHYSIFYSTDSGDSWQLLATELVSPTYTVDTASMAGTNDARFRVVATDGINIDFDETDEAVSILNKAPDVAILSPYDGQVIGPGELAVLYGSGSDLEDGNLADEALEWSSDREGPLGPGSSLPINTFSSGEHVITLTGRDSFGIVSRSSVKIFVGERIFLPNIQKQ